MCFIVSFRFIAVMAQKKDRNNAALKKAYLGNNSEYYNE